MYQTLATRLKKNGCRSLFTAGSVSDDSNFSVAEDCSLQYHYFNTNSIINDAESFLEFTVPYSLYTQDESEVNQNILIQTVPLKGMKSA